MLSLIIGFGIGCIGYFGYRYISKAIKKRKQDNNTSDSDII